MKTELATETKIMDENKAGDGDGDYRQNFVGAGDRDEDCRKNGDGG